VNCTRAVTPTGDDARDRFGEAPAAAVGARTGGAATAATAAAAAAARAATGAFCGGTSPSSSGAGPDPGAASSSSSSCTLGRFGAEEASSAAGRSVTFRASNRPRTATFTFDGLLMSTETSALVNSGNARAASACDTK